MRSLKESLFDVDIIEKSLFGDEAFKKWINQPNILWYIYYYWEYGATDWLDDFVNGDWKKYKPLVDNILQILDEVNKKVLGPKKYSWQLINFESIEYDDDVSRAFSEYEEFENYMDSANYEIVKHSIEEKDGIYKMVFKRGLPNNSNVAALFQKIEAPFIKPGKLDGVILLTNNDTIMILGFPKGTPKEILKLFNIN